MSIKQIILSATFMVFMQACNSKPPQKVIQVTNPLDVERTLDMVSVPFSDISEQNLDAGDTLVAENLGTGELFAVQLSNTSGSEAKIVVLFQPVIGPKESLSFAIRKQKKGDAIVDRTMNCYSRFVPERIDDYAWENDRVAFRTYGPEAQRLVDENLPGGTLSSGIDCWLKRVDYPVINKWYKKAETGGTYHKDDGEGLDNYHVGISRGCGGTCIYNPDTKGYYISKNFVSWEKIEDGTLRARFNLTYAPWVGEGDTIREIKHISIDKGSNLTRFEIELDGSDHLTTGITLHEKKGEMSHDINAGWFNYTEPYFKSELSCAIVVDPKYVTGYDEYITEEPEKSHMFVQLKAIDGKIVYYSGFFWKESNQFASVEAWKNYLKTFASEVSHPLEVTVQ